MALKPSPTVHISNVKMCSLVWLKCKSCALRSVLLGKDEGMDPPWPNHGSGSPVSILDHQVRLLTLFMSDVKFCPAFVRVYPWNIALFGWFSEPATLPSSPSATPSWLLAPGIHPRDPHGSNTPFQADLTVTDIPGSVLPGELSLSVVPIAWDSYLFASYMESGSLHPPNI